jgi:type II secretory pathway component PulJ
MATMNAQCSQSGHTLVQSLLGMGLCSGVLMVAFAVFAWVQASHTHMRLQADLHTRLNTVMGVLRERVQRAGAPALLFNSQSQAALATTDVPMTGSDKQLGLLHLRSLTPADCQGHQASSEDWLRDDFKRSTKHEFSCKDSLRDNTSYQALVDGIQRVHFRYAQALPGTPPLLQWRSAAQVTDWQAVRGLEVCVENQTQASLQAPLSAACAASNSLEKAVAWRGVASLMHHP